MLTKSDLKSINNLFQTQFKSNIKPVIDEIKTVNVHNSRIEMKLIDMSEKFEKNLKQWKSELFDKIDPILNRVITSEQENVVLRAREEGKQEGRQALEGRINKLESIHPNNHHIQS